MIYRSDYNLPVIKVDENAYQVKVKAPVNKVKDREAIKKGLNCSTVIQNHNKNELLFCRKIKEAEVIEYIEDNEIVNVK